MTFNPNIPTPIARECTQVFRNDVNRHEPSVLSGVVFGPGYMPPRVSLAPLTTDQICLDLSQGGRAITPANLAAALGLRDVSAAVAMLIDTAAGQAAHNVSALVSQISSVVFAQAERYPLDRPDLRTPDEGGPS